jgi:prepilin-type N-terminal cleavage/methylation domain-containing protein
MIRRVGPGSGRPRAAARRGFTLIELGIVVAIIGVLIALVLIASAEGVERARARATQATITKLDAGLTERLDAILQQRVEPNGAHQYMAAIRPALPAPGSPGPGDAATLAFFWGLTSDSRAQVIAQHDLVKAELPDVFVVNTGDLEYPFNFAGLHYPDPTGTAPSNTPAVRAGFVLPLGHLVGGVATGPSQGYRPGSFTSTGTPLNYGPGANWIDPAALPGIVPVNSLANSLGIYGASYDVRAALNQLLGVAPRGYDKVDNDGNGWIDELTASETGMAVADLNAILTRLTANHRHTTARSEVLYALLIGAQGPLGAIFTTEDFGPNEIGDTDEDGLPEFLDGWGKPIQFYRWPIHFSAPVGTSLQKGRRFYDGPIEPRQTSALDPNQLLVAPAWFMGTVNAAAPPGIGAFAGGVGPNGEVSGRAFAFGLYFHSLVEQNARLPDGSGYATYTQVGQLWERGATSQASNPLACRRAYFTRPLVVSGGQDGQLGIAQLGFNYGDYSMPLGAAPPAPMTPSALLVQVAEGTASTLAPQRSLATAPYYTVDSSQPGADALTAGLGDATEGWALDDITNQTIQTTAGGTGQ